LYQRLAEAGAVYGNKFGWERPNWFALNGTPAIETPSFDRGPAFDAIGAEHRAVRERVALIDMSSFSKYEVRGRGALALLQRLAVNNLDRPVGTIVYTQLCNERGGIEADVTITRLADDRFYFVTGSALGVRDPLDDRAAHCGRRQRRDRRAHVGESGDQRLRPALARSARKVDRRAARQRTFPVHERPRARSRLCAGAGAARHLSGRAWLRAACAGRVRAPALRAAMGGGRGLRIANAGYRAINSLRLEKHYLVWGSDLTPDYNPYEAGLGFCVALDKGEFLAREALAQVKMSGPKQRLTWFDAPAELNLFGGEIVTAGDRVLGRVTSGGYGYTVQRSLCCAYIAATEPAHPEYAVEVMGSAIPRSAIPRRTTIPNAKRSSPEPFHETLMANSSTVLTPELEALLATRREGYGMPRPFYHTDALYEAEVRRIWYGGWLFAGFTFEIANPGDYLTFEIDKSSVIVMRDDDGEVRAFHNVCRHRGTQLCRNESGHLEKIVCPYHSWTYSRSGELLACHGMQEGIDKSKHGLKAVHAEVVAGLIYISLADAPPSFQGLRTEFEAAAKPQGFDRARIAKVIDYEVEGNWKLVWENNRECFHCPSCHPQYIKANFDIYEEEYASPAIRAQMAAAVARTHDKWASEGLAITHAEGGLARFPGPGSRSVVRSRSHGDGGRLRTESMDGKRVAPLMGDYQDCDVGVLRMRSMVNFWVHGSCDHAVAARLSPAGRARRTSAATGSSISSRRKAPTTISRSCCRSGTSPISRTGTSRSGSRRVWTRSATSPVRCRRRRSTTSTHSSAGI
jgi:glycine cleavage system aminomethyltransferase T/phenylpropionate dioxygenase-like ring-hydroxylating dioxygenase large terminal subunit